MLIDRCYRIRWSAQVGDGDADAMAAGDTKSSSAPTPTPEAHTTTPIHPPNAFPITTALQLSSSPIAKMVGLPQRMRKLQTRLLAIRLGSGALILPKEVKRIHMRFAPHIEGGHMGSRYTNHSLRHGQNTLLLTRHF
jgi:hypothetical protein